MKTVPTPRIRWRTTEPPESWDRARLFSPGAEVLDPRLARFTWLDQVHGTTVVTVDEPGMHRGARADGAVTGCPGAVLVVRTADCTPVLFEGTVNGPGASPILGVAHGGWRGLLDGILHNTVAAMRHLGAEEIVGWLGPHIQHECYEFAGPELSLMTDRFGGGVVGKTSWGTDALDLQAVVSAAFGEAGIIDGGRLQGPSCTACNARRCFSHRARRDEGRQALIAEILP